ncbi:MAG: hypothetical protein U0M69_06075 [Lachnospiraceae bacterium]|nr:hypothetical protein [Lachnospiraceae bacterium]
MITIFNRKELLITYDMQKQSEVRTLLQNHRIKYDIKVFNRKSASPLSAGMRAHTGTFGEDLSKAYEYKIYVKKEDYERACALMNGKI